MKMPDQIANSMFAPCGMNCMLCYSHLKTKKPCAGCLNDETNMTARCRSCAIKTCVKEKGLTYCFKCEVFSCKKINNLDRSYQKRYQVSLIEYSEFAKEHGLEAFFEREKLRWTCASCSGVVSLHDKTCRGCEQQE